MAALKTIKTKIRSFEKTRKVTKAMEAVSAAKMRKAQQRALKGRAYARAASTMLARVSGSGELSQHPLMQERPVFKALYVVITSDKGLAGGLNSGVIRAVSQDILDMELAASEVGIVAVGRKANEFFSKRGFSMEAYHPNTDAISSEMIREIVDECAHRFTLGAVDVVKVAYQNFISTFEQRPTIRTVFPMTLSEVQKIVEDIVPVRGALKETVSVESIPHVYTVEPSQESVLRAVLPKLASVFLYHSLLESQASEHSARMVSMKSASDKAGEMGKKLVNQFNKARQAAITREVSEITGGMEAMSTQ